MKLETIKWKELTEDEKIASLKRPVIESIEEQESVITEIFNEVNPLVFSEFIYVFRSHCYYESIWTINYLK